MDRKQALELLHRHLRTKNLFKHCLACEAVMAKLANISGEDSEAWSLAGLLHDIDYDETYEKPEIHAKIGAEILREAGVGEDVVHAVLAHALKAPFETRMDKALFAIDPLTGFLVACALMTPDKKISSVDSGFAMRRFKEKGFARGASRDQMMSCNELELPIEEFVEIGIAAMREIAEEIGL